jgi:hypothetical protein
MCLGGKWTRLDGLRVIAVRASFRSYRVDRVALERATSASVCRSCVAKNLEIIKVSRGLKSIAISLQIACKVETLGKKILSVLILQIKQTS